MSMEALVGHAATSLTLVAIVAVASMGLRDFRQYDLSTGLWLAVGWHVGVSTLQGATLGGREALTLIVAAAIQVFSPYWVRRLNLRHFDAYAQLTLGVSAIGVYALQHASKKAAMLPPERTYGLFFGVTLAVLAATFVIRGSRRWARTVIQIRSGAELRSNAVVIVAVQIVLMLSLGLARAGFSAPPISAIGSLTLLPIAALVCSRRRIRVAMILVTIAGLWLPQELLSQGVSSHLPLSRSIVLSITVGVFLFYALSAGILPKNPVLGRLQTDFAPPLPGRLSIAASGVLLLVNTVIGAVLGGSAVIGLLTGSLTIYWVVQRILNVDTLILPVASIIAVLGCYWAFEVGASLRLWLLAIVLMAVVSLGIALLGSLYCWWLRSLKRKERFILDLTIVFSLSMCLPNHFVVRLSEPMTPIAALVSIQSVVGIFLLASLSERWLPRMRGYVFALSHPLTGASHGVSIFPLFLILATSCFLTATLFMSLFVVAGRQLDFNQLAVVCVLPILIARSLRKLGPAVGLSLAGLVGWVGRDSFPSDASPLWIGVSHLLVVFSAAFPRNGIMERIYGRWFAPSN